MAAWTWIAIAEAPGTTSALADMQREMLRLAEFTKDGGRSDERYGQILGRLEGPGTASAREGIWMVRPEEQFRFVPNSQGRIDGKLGGQRR